MITRNKVRLDAKGYNQKEGIDYDETHAPLARLEVVRQILSFAYMSGFKLFRVDVRVIFSMGLSMRKCIFLNHLDLKITDFQIVFTS